MSADSSAIHRLDAGRTRVARGATLDGLVAETSSGPGIAVRDLEPLTSLVIHTCNSRYHVVVSSGGAIVIQGGSFFQDPTPAHLDGSSLGSSFLKVGWIGIGLRMEINARGQRIVTTPVRSIVRDDGARPHRITPTTAWWTARWPAERPPGARRSRSATRCISAPSPI